MGISLEFVSFDNIFAKTETDKIIINDINIFDNDYREILNSIIVKNYDEDTISLIPSCKCGHIQGTYYVGDKCELCNTTVAHELENNINYLIWATKPIGVCEFISPIVLSMLEEKKIKVNKTSIDLIQWLINPSYRLTNKLIDDCEMGNYILTFIKKNNIERNYNSFVNNFNLIMEFLRDVHNKLKPKNTVKNNHFFDTIIKNKHIIFSNYLPFPNSIIFAYESNELGRFINKNIIGPLNSIRKLSGIDLRIDVRPVTLLNKQNKVANSLYDLATYYKTYFKTNIFSKPGLIRQHILSTRSHFTARAVITSLTCKHKYDELHIPWAIGISLFRMHILNKLERRGYTYKNACLLMLDYNRIYNPLLDEIFHELIHDSGTGIKAFFNRNPSLTRSSIQSVRITNIKNDTNDNTFSMSLLIAPGFNADCDGDALNLTLVSGVNDIIKNEMHNFEPHNNILSLTGSNEFSNNIKFPKPIVSTLANWFRKKE